jgi:phospholipase/carboxylesterase
MNDELLACVEVEPSSGPATGAVLWLHGLGADGHDFEPLVPYLGLGDDHRIRFVFPHAPRIPVTINMGMVMPAWYDIVQMDLRRAHDESGVRASQSRVEALLARELDRGVPAERIVLAGFSQGGAVALHTALRHPERLAGVLALSTYLVCEDSLEAERSAANRDVPLFQAHGTADPMVPVDRGLAARDRLVALGYDVTWKTYPMEHQVHPEEIRDIGTWLAERFA